LRKSGVDARFDLGPFSVVDDLRADFDLLVVVVEMDRLDAPRRDLAMHGAQIAEALAAAGLAELVRPFLIIGLGAGVIADLIAAIRRLGGDDAVNKPLARVDLGERNEHLQLRHLCASSKKKARARRALLAWVWLAFERRVATAPAFARGARVLVRRGRA
jgi:hypothetical protein